jgi:hypothetical protein
VADASAWAAWTAARDDSLRESAEITRKHISVDDAITAICGGEQ